MCSVDWGVANPRKFQAQAIHRGVFYDDSFEMIISKTEYGKSLITLGITTMRRVDSIIQVPHMA